MHEGVYFYFAFIFSKSLQKVSIWRRLWLRIEDLLIPSFELDFTAAAEPVVSRSDVENDLSLPSRVRKCDRRRG